MVKTILSEYWRAGASVLEKAWVSTWWEVGAGGF